MGSVCQCVLVYHLQLEKDGERGMDWIVYQMRSTDQSTLTNQLDTTMILEYRQMELIGDPLDKISWIKWKSI